MDMHRDDHIVLLNRPADRGETTDTNSEAGFHESLYHLAQEFLK